MKIVSCLVVSLFFIVTLNACSTVSQNSNQENPDKLVVVYLPNESDDRLSELREGFSVELSNAIGIPVEEYKTTDYTAAIEALRTEKADLALLGALNIVQAASRADIEPIAMVAEGGEKETSGYSTLFVTNVKNSDINSILDIKGKTITFVDPNSTSGNLIPCAEIIKAFPDLHLTMEDLHSNGSFFEAVSFSGKHVAGLKAVSMGDVDVAPCASDTYKKEIAANTVDSQSVKVIHESSLIPSSAFVIRSNFNENFKENIQKFLLGYDNEDYFENFLWDKTARFVECSIDDYSELKILMNTLLD